MNKQDYIEQGRALFHSNGSLLNPAESWQQKAINEGWRQARDEWRTGSGLIEMEEFQTVGGNVAGVVTGIREVESLEYVGSGEFSIGGMVRHSQNIPRTPTGRIATQAPQHQSLPPVLGCDLEYSRARELYRLASTARLLVYDTEAETDADHARRSHVLDLLVRSLAFGTSKRAKRLARKALVVAYRLADARA